MDSKEFYLKLKELNVPLADIKDLFNHRYKMDFAKVSSDSERFNMPIEFLEDLELIKENYPLAYLIGFVDFCNLRIEVDEDVLIPRNETEELMYIVKNEVENPRLILDLCTGSGCIALSLKSFFKDSVVYASDISPFALKKAKENSLNNGLNVNFVESDFLEYFVKNNLKFDLIVSNPPYIPVKTKLDKSLDYEPSIALYSGKDGLDSYRSIIKELPKVLKENGVCYLEIEDSNIEKIHELIKEETSYRSSTIFDMNKKSRFVKIY